MLAEGLQPKNFKVLSTKNITNWIKYYEEFYTRCKAKSLEATTKITQFMARVDALIKDGCKAQLSDKSGYLTKGDFEFYYEISDSGYIHQKISFTDYKTNIETFERLTKLQ